MEFQKNYRLQQLGITQWVLRRPAALRGEIAISIPSNIRLVIIADRLPTLNATFISDVLQVLKVSTDQVLRLIHNHVLVTPIKSCCNIWWLGCKTVPNLERGYFVSPSLEELQKNPDAKNVLWKQICNCKHNFFL